MCFETEPEKAEIAVDGADPLYREIRIENALTDADGKKVSLKPGAQVEVTIEAEPQETPLQRLLTRLWCDVLHLERVGAHDDFFSLGGDSLSAFQIAQRAREHGLQLEEDDVFRWPTIGQLVSATARGEISTTAAGDSTTDRP